MTIQQMLLVGGKPAERTYVDECFKINCYVGNGVSGSGTRTLTHNLGTWADSGVGGMIINKQMGASGSYHDWYVYSGSTWNGGSHKLNSGTYHDYAHSGGEITSITNTTYNVTGTGFKHNANDKHYVSYLFKNVPGFFTHKQYTGTDSTQTLSHDLGAVPGMIWIHRGNQFNTTNWAVYHRGLNKGNNPQNHRIWLNSSDDSEDEDIFGDTAPTSTHFTVGGSHNETNADGDTYTAYFFAGGPSSATGAASLPWDGSGDRLHCGTTNNKTADFNFGSGDLTIECWIKASDTQTDKPNIVCIGDDDDQGEVNFMWDHEDYANKITFWSRNKGSTPFLTSQTHYFNGDEVWHHVAVTRASNVWRLFVDGIQEFETTWTGNTTDENEYLTIGNTTTGIQQSNVGYFNGRISNFRIVKGTAVYTESFDVPSEPLSNITNTKLLCCNDASSKTGATVTPITLTEQSLGAPNTDSPFDDPLGQIFGTSGDKPLIKCGHYRGNGDATNGTRVYLGFEPQFLLIKSESYGEEWHVFDEVRGMSTENDFRMEFTSSSTELTTADFVEIHADGFTALHNPNVNSSDQEYIYMAVRREDGYVKKPVETATDVFAIDTGNSSGTIPTYDSNFRVDMAIRKQPATSDNHFLVARKMGLHYLATNSASDSADGTNQNFHQNSDLGWAKDTGSSSFQSWMWKRHAGFDVVTYTGNGGTTGGREVRHQLGQKPQMMWIKHRGSSNYNWTVYHEGADVSGSSPEDKYLVLNENYVPADLDNVWNDTQPTTTHFTLGSNDMVNNGSQPFIAFLFASVSGISMVGTYTGSGSAQNITTLGFQPKYIIIKPLSTAESWMAFDTTRGWGSGDDYGLELNTTSNHFGADIGAPLSNGFSLAANTGSALANYDTHKYAFYAHA